VRQALLLCAARGIGNFGLALTAALADWNELASREPGHRGFAMSGMGG